VTLTGEVQHSLLPHPDDGAEIGLDGVCTCAVFFVDVVRFSTRPVSDQQSIKQTLNGCILSVIQNIPKEKYIALDTGDGVAITFLNDTEQALMVALKLQEHLQVASPRQAAFRVRIGINLGPVKLVKDINGHTNVIGDGINVAQRIMSFAAPGGVLLSRSYYEMVSSLKPEYAQKFLRPDHRLDKHGREHSVYELCAKPTGVRQVWESARAAIRGRIVGYGNNAHKSRRSVLTASVLMAFALVLFSDPKRNGPDPVTAALIDQPAQDTARTGVVKFANAPWGEIRVDGKVKGASPPLTQMHLSAGRHRIEVRNANLKPHIEEVLVTPGQSATVRHRFVQG